jgi:hypothetical protein
VFQYCTSTGSYLIVTVSQYGTSIIVTLRYHTEFARLFPGDRKLILCCQLTSSLLITVLPHFSFFFISDHPHVSNVIILMCGGDGFSVGCKLTANLSELMCCLGCGRFSVPGRTRSAALDCSCAVSTALLSYRPCSTVMVPLLQYCTSTGR